MFTSITTRRLLVTTAVIAGLLAAAGPASAARSVLPNPSTTVEATMLMHGDFSTFLTNQDSPPRDNLLVFSGDAYDNEMGVRNASPQLRP
jgi:cytochrome c oxidase assembly factor CtaG